MANNYGANQYRQMSITTASRSQILLMLYEGAIQNVKKASISIEKKDLQIKGKCIGKAHDIINELLNTLDFEIGGKVAEDLERLYIFIIRELMAANLENSSKKLQGVQRILETLLDGWKIAVEQINKQNLK